MHSVAFLRANLEGLEKDFYLVTSLRWASYDFLDGYSSNEPIITTNDDDIQTSTINCAFPKLMSRRLQWKCFRDMINGFLRQSKNHFSRTTILVCSAGRSPFANVFMENMCFYNFVQPLERNCNIVKNVSGKSNFSEKKSKSKRMCSTNEIFWGLTCLLQ